MVQREPASRDAPPEVAPREARLIPQAIGDGTVEVFGHLPGDEQQLGTGRDHRHVAVAADRCGHAVGIEATIFLSLSSCQSSCEWPRTSPLRSTETGPSSLTAMTVASGSSRL